MKSFKKHALQLWEYIKSFKDFIPTWIICVFAFFGVFAYPLLIAVILMVIQYIQRKRIRKRSEQMLISLNDELTEEYQKKLDLKDSEIEELRRSVSDRQNEISERNQSVYASKRETSVMEAEKKRIEREVERLNQLLISQSQRSEQEKSDLRQEISRLNGLLDAGQENLGKEYEEKKRTLEEELSTIKQEIATLNNRLIKKYYDFSDYEQITSQDCKNSIFLLKQEEDNLRERGADAIIQARSQRNFKIEERIIRQMLRTFNAECDNIMFNVSLKNIDRARKQVQNSFSSINKLYSVDGASLQSELLELKLEEITMMYTYELKYQQEKDLQREIREQMLDEERARKEIEEQKKKIDKDLQQHLGEVNRLMKYMQKSQIDAEKQLYMDKIRELEDRIKELESDKETVLEREANARAGFVYIISNIGSFGENIYKIGMTRRLEPMDRVKELSSASVPFEFDVHAMIFSSDAPELETTLHRHFADRAVNKVNPRKEFYNVDIDEIERVVKESYNDTVQFTKIPVAAEWRQSLNMLEQGE